MMRIVPEPPAEVGRAITCAAERAGERGAPLPTHFLVDDGSDGWLREACDLSPAERAGSVIGTARDETLIRAVQLGIGGATGLPSSTDSMEKAMLGAASNGTQDGVLTSDLGVVESVLLGGNGRLVAPAALRFWRCQLGIRGLAERLGQLGVALTRPWALCAGPSLVVADVSDEEIQGRWTELGAGRPNQVLPELVSAEVTARELRLGVSALIEALVAALSTARELCGAGAQPVCVLPSGSRVGAWTLERSSIGASGGWTATPLEETRWGYRWAIDDPSGQPRFAVDVASTGEVASCSDAIVRAPGWLTGDLWTGAPAALLVDRIAGEALRRGLSLWWTNIGPKGLQVALRSGPSLWVDGSAVPG